MQYQLETRSALARLRPGSVSYASAILGAGSEEPLLVGLDSLLRYAKAYALRFESRLSEDHVLGPAWLSAAKGFRALLDGDGAVAMEMGRATDSKDNGACEAIFWAALAVAGFTESDL